MSAQRNSATTKIHIAEKHWHNTIGEYLLRFGGIFLALSIVVIGIKYGYNDTFFSTPTELGNVIKHDSERSEKTVLFIIKFFLVKVSIS